MTIYTQADADAAKAKLALDTQTLADDQQAVITAQAGITSAGQAVTDAEAALAAAQQALVDAQANLATEQAALSSANDAVTAVQADMVAQQTIIDAFAAQPPVAASFPTPAILIPAPPQLSSPAIIGGTTQLGTSGKSYTFKNRKTNAASPTKEIYKTVGGSGIHIPLIDISDHDLDGACGLIRIQYEEVDLLRINRISLTNGGYDPGVICGVVHIGHGIVHEMQVADVVYDRKQPITSPGDIYAGLFTGGGHTKTGFTYGQVDKFSFTDCKISNYWTAYTDVTKYPNSDGSVSEKLCQNGNYLRCEFRHGADAGIDRKSPNTVFEEVVFEDNRENDKLWCPANDVSIYSFNPRHAHCVVTPQPQYGRIDYHCQFRRFASSNPKTPLFDIQRAGWNAVYDEVDLSGLPAGQVLAICESTAFGSTINLGGKTYTIEHGTVLL